MKQVLNIEILMKAMIILMCCFHYIATTQERSIIFNYRGFKLSVAEMLEKTITYSFASPKEYSVMMEQCKGHKPTGPCLKEREQIMEENLMQKYKYKDKSNPDFKALLFCGVLRESGSCILDFTSAYKCPKGEIEDRFKRRVKMEFKFAVAEAQGICTGNGWDLMQEMTKAGIFSEFCFQMKAVEISHCRAEFIYSQALQYSEQEIDQFEFTRKNIAQACSDLEKLDKCMMKIQKKYENSTGKCSGRKDIYNNYLNVQKALTESYYPFHPDCKEDYYKEPPKASNSKPQTSTDGVDKLQNNLFVNFIVIVISLSIFLWK